MEVTFFFQATSGSSCEGPVIRFVPEKPSLGPGVRGIVTLMTVSVCVQTSATECGYSQGAWFFSWSFLGFSRLRTWKILALRDSAGFSGSWRGARDFGTCPCYGQNVNDPASGLSKEVFWGSLGRGCWYYTPTPQSSHAGPNLFKAGLLSASAKGVVQCLWHSTYRCPAPTVSSTRHSWAVYVGMMESKSGGRKGCLALGGPWVGQPFVLPGASAFL